MAREHSESRVTTTAAPSNIFTRAFWAVNSAAHNLNFIQLHYIYFIGTCLLSAVIFWASSTPSRSVTFIDALFLCTSAMTEAGLNTINLSTLNTWQQIMLFVLIMIGSAIFVSAFVVNVRLNAFEDRFLDEIDRERRLRRRRTFAPLSRTLSRARSHSGSFYRGAAQDAKPDAFGPGAHDADTLKQLDVDSATSIRGRCPPSHGHEATAASAFTTPAPASALKVRGLDVSGSPVTTATSMPPIAKELSPSAESGMDVQSGPNLAKVPSNPDRISFAPDTRFLRASSSRDKQDDLGHRVIHHLIPSSGVGARPLSRGRSRSQTSLATFEPRRRDDSLVGSESPGVHTRFLGTGVLARNSTFHHMSEVDRERLGGLEYKCVRLLSWLVPVYFVLWQLLGAIGCGAWVAANRPATAYENGLNPWWVGAFNAVSAFNNSGMSLLDANMVAFQTSVYLLLSMGLFILAGNTCYPIFLRLIIWTMWKLTPDKPGKMADFRCVLRFLLDHPRRVYTNLFPSRETWWLLATVVVLNGIDCVFFSILNIGNQAITYLSPGFEFLDGLFQAFAVRSGGFYVVPIPSTRISLQILYLVMMYISVYPVVITMRNSNVYEERSLGIYADDPGYDDYEKQHRKRRVNFLALLGHAPGGPRWPDASSAGAHASTGWAHKTYFVQQQLRAQLAHDLWWLVLAIWLIMMIEGAQFARDPAAFSVFNVVFEVVSGYATVGISVGVPDDAYSFCGSWHALSKLILCAVMVRGRHRGLPVAIDKAVMLPSGGRELAGWEEEDARLRWEGAKAVGADVEGAKA